MERRERRGEFPGKNLRNGLITWGGSSDGGDLKPERRASGRPFPGLVEVGAWGRQSARLQSILFFPPNANGARNPH